LTHFDDFETPFFHCGNSDGCEARSDENQSILHIQYSLLRYLSENLELLIWSIWILRKYVWKFNVIHSVHCSCNHSCSPTHAQNVYRFTNDSQTWKLQRVPSINRHTQGDVDTKEYRNIILIYEINICKVKNIK